MEIKKLVDYVNRSYIASDILRAPDIYYYMDLVIDDINDRLQSNFPTFSDWGNFVIAWNNWVSGKDPVPDEGLPEDYLDPMTYPFLHHHHCHLDIPQEARAKLIRNNANYNAFPDKYLRSVVALGVAVKFYTRDEEGEQIALDYQNRYEMALFKMTRDYIDLVPWYFQNNRGGFIDFTYDRERFPCDLRPRGVVLRGGNTRIL